MECRVHGIETFGCDDGYGIRYIVFFKVVKVDVFIVITFQVGILTVEK